MPKVNQQVKANCQKAGLLYKKASGLREKDKRVFAKDKQPPK